jgi:hypothetical protein
MGSLSSLVSYRRHSILVGSPDYPPSAMGPKKKEKVPTTSAVSAPLSSLPSSEKTAANTSKSAKWKAKKSLSCKCDTRKQRKITPTISNNTPSDSSSNSSNSKPEVVEVTGNKASASKKQKGSNNLAKDEDKKELCKKLMSYHRS